MDPGTANSYVTVPQRGIPKAGSDQKQHLTATFKPPQTDLKVALSPDPPLRIPLLGGRRTLQTSASRQLARAQIPRSAPKITKENDNKHSINKYRKKQMQRKRQKQHKQTQNETAATLGLLPQPAARAALGEMFGLCIRHILNICVGP